jgi:hypothetical protein
MTFLLHGLLAGMAWHGGRKMIFKLDTTSIMFIKSFEDTL